MTANRIDRDSFVVIAARQATVAGTVMPREGGYTLAGRPYAALRCRCQDPACPKWAMVHDAPADRAHFSRLFGGDNV